MKEATCESMVTNEVTSENRIFRTCTPIKKAALLHSKIIVLEWVSLKIEVNHKGV